MSTPRRFWLAILVLGLLAPAAPAADSKAPEGKRTPSRSRTFRFTYATTVTGLAPGQAVRIWLPVPPSDNDQEVRMLAHPELPGKWEINREPKFGNKVLYLQAKADAEGKVPVQITYRVTRHEVKGDLSDRPTDARQLDPFLKPDALIPIGGKPMVLLKGKHLPSNQLALARVLYDVVDDHMRYEKTGTGWGRGDAVWACQSGYGNCTDFHSLFIALARTEKIPAKFQIGFPLPEKRGAGTIPGYHCWAMFRPAGKGWVPVDISEANQNPRLRNYNFGHLSEDRVSFSTGRDINLVPKQAGPPLNYFIYPHVEVDGKPYPPSKIKNRFSYQDVSK